MCIDYSIPQFSYPYSYIISISPTLPIYGQALLRKRKVGALHSLIVKVSFPCSISSLNILLQSFPYAPTVIQLL